MAHLGQTHAYHLMPLLSQYNSQLLTQVIAEVGVLSNEADVLA
jgi:hypothetical protein